MPKISELVAVSNVSTDDLLLVVNDPGGAPSSNKITMQNLATSLTGMLRTANSTNVGVIKPGEGLTANSTGFLNVTNTVGYTGSAGSLGYTGSSGSAGAAGTTGFTGSSGEVGFTGSVGAAGGSTRTIQNVSVVGPTTITGSVVFADPNAAGANVNLLLPSSPASGSIYTVKNINAGGSVVYIQTDGINGMENESGSIGTGIYATISTSGNRITWIYDGSSSTYRVIG